MSCCLLFVASCGDPVEDAADVAKSCGDQACPVGTAPKELASVSASYEISGGYDPTTYAADGAYKRMGTGKCEYACQVIAPCPESTFPVISATCFTCATINAQGQVQQGSCQ